MNDFFKLEYNEELLFQHEIDLEHPNQLSEIPKFFIEDPRLNYHDRSPLVDLSKVVKAIKFPKKELKKKSDSIYKQALAIKIVEEACVSYNLKDLLPRLYDRKENRILIPSSNVKREIFSTSLRSFPLLKIMPK